MAEQKRKRVLIIGAGAAGTACAWSLSRFPERYEVHVWEALPVPGGVASSCVVKDGKVVLNDQVQGGAPSYRHNLALLALHGFAPHPVAMRIAFGTGEAQWTNHSPSPLVARLQPEIARFGRLLRWVARFEPLFVLVPISKLLKWWRFSDDFCNRMVFPLVALFFGTGNQTPHVASAVIARVFLDPDLRLFDYCPERLLNSVPDMFAFPVLQHVFTTIAARSGYNLCCSRPAAKVVRGRQGVTATDAAGVAEQFDDVVFACDAETVLKVLDKPSWLERKLLGNVRYYTDYCLTHEDDEYMARMYDIKPEQKDNYFVRNYESQPQKIEMSFNLVTYQPHLKEAGLEALYQTYYLDAADKGLWTDQEVAPGKVLARRWMRQFAHTWTHFATWVPWGRLIQGTQHAWYAGSYTLFNTQEIAVMSGLAAAERLGADYPFPHDPLAAQQFDMYMGITHGVRRRNKGDAKAKAAAEEAFKQGVAAATAAAAAAATSPTVSTGTAAASVATEAPAGAVSTEAAAGGAGAGDAGLRKRRSPGSSNTSVPASDASSGEDPAMTVTVTQPPTTAATAAASATKTAVVGPQLKGGLKKDLLPVAPPPSEQETSRRLGLVVEARG